MQKTTVYLEHETYRRLKQIARQRRQPPAALVRQAIAEYTERHAPRPKAKSVGAFRSGRRDLSRRAEVLMDGFGKE